MNDSLQEDDIELDFKNNNEYKDEPLQLIDFNQNKFELNSEALELIKSIEEEIIIVAIVGKARTGKSYLMNLLLDNVGKNKGFKVDSRTYSCTKGIWVWGNYKKSLNGNAKILFIDSEGTASTDRSTKTYDSRIFALVVLISTLFIYNTTSNIDESGIAELSLAAHLSSAITTNTNVSKEDMLIELSPKFIWVLRDFILEKIHPETGVELTSKEYLEMCLRRKISGKNSNDNNLIRNNIIKYFPERDCITLTRPVEEERDLQKLNDIPFEKLKSSFKIEFKNLKDKVYKETLPKRINGKRLTGPILVNLILEFVNTINSGFIPNINNSWDSVINKDIKDYYDKAINKYKINLKRIKDKIEQDELVKNLNDLKLEAFMSYNKIYFINHETFCNKEYLDLYEETRNKLENDIESLEKKALSSNSEKTNQMNDELLKKYYKLTEKRFLENYYKKINADDYIFDLNEFFNNYLNNSIGPNKTDLFTEFMIIKEKIKIDYFCKMLNSDVEKKIHDYETKIKCNREDLGQMSKQYDREEELNQIYTNRINNLESDLKIVNNDYERLLDTLEKKKQELGLLKDCEKKEDLARYEVKPKNLEEILKNGSKSKKEGCQCRCEIY